MDGALLLPDKYTKYVSSKPDFCCANLITSE